MPLVILTWGLGPPVTKLITAPPLAAVLVRFWLSAAVMLVMVGLTGRRLSRRMLRRTVPAGLLFGLNNVAFFFAIQHASIAVVSVAFALQPAVVLLLAGRLLGESPTRWHIAWTVVGIAGAAVVVSGADPRVHTDLAGVILACVSMVTLSAYHVINRAVRATQPVDPLEWMTGATMFAALGILPAAAVATTAADYRQIGPADLAYIAFVALGVGVIGHTLMSWAHKNIAAGRSALYLLLFNVVAVAVAWFVNDQPMTLSQIAGGLLVLGAAGAIVSRPGSVKVRLIDPST